MIDQAVPLVVRRHIQAPREQIFRAFTRADLLVQWFTPCPDITIDILRFEFAENGRFRFRYSMPDGRTPVVGGVYERIREPSELACSWIWEAPDPLAGVAMRVLFQFIEQDAGTEVVITHEGIPSDAACTIHESGWDGALSSLDEWTTHTLAKA